MIEVQEAVSILRKNPFPVTHEYINLQHANGRVLLEDLIADRDFPPFDRVSMDGIAIKFSKYEQGQRVFPIEKTVGAGEPEYALNSSGLCVEIMTGAILPKGTDTIIKYEDLKVEKGQATIMAEGIKKGQNVHMQGADRMAEEVLKESPSIITPAEIGIAATIGKTQLKVAKTPRTIVLSTGDELVSVDQTPLPHQIRSSNVFSIQAAFDSLGMVVETDHIPDQREVVEKKLSSYLQMYDLIILIGGSSKGKYDYVPGALDKLKVERKFYKVKQRPGKPFWFGVKEGKTFVFALPGNPVSSFMCTERYIKEWLRDSLGIPKAWQSGLLMEDFTFKPDLTYYLQVRTVSKNGKILAFPVAGGGSGDLANLADADGFMELPKGHDHFRAGEIYPLLLYR